MQKYDNMKNLNGYGDFVYKAWQYTLLNTFLGKRIYFECIVGWLTLHTTELLHTYITGHTEPNFDSAVKRTRMSRHRPRSIFWVLPWNSIEVRITYWRKSMHTNEEDPPTHLGIFFYQKFVNPNNKYSTWFKFPRTRQKKVDRITYLHLSIKMVQ
jgi:hypothetical protein